MLATELRLLEMDEAADMALEDALAAASLMRGEGSESASSPPCVAILSTHLPEADWTLAYELALDARCSAE